MQYVGNFKSAIYNKLKDENLKDKLKDYLIAGPLLLLETGANVDFTFDSFDELKEHPMAQTFMPSYKQLLEGILGNDLDTVKEGLDMSAIPESKKEHYLYRALK